MTNPTVVEMSAQARMTEMRQAATKHSTGHRGFTARKTATPPSSASRTASVRVGEPRRAIGWFLVNVGLRLALPRAGTTGR
jgi:hypothetical protein